MLIVEFICWCECERIIIIVLTTVNPGVTGHEMRYNLLIYIYKTPLDEGLESVIFSMIVLSEGNADFLINHDIKQLIITNT